LFERENGSIAPLFKEKWKNPIPVILQHAPYPALFSRRNGEERTGDADYYANHWFKNVDRSRRKDSFH